MQVDQASRQGRGSLNTEPFVYQLEDGMLFELGEDLQASLEAQVSPCSLPAMCLA